MKYVIAILVTLMVIMVVQAGSLNMLNNNESQACGKSVECPLNQACQRGSCRSIIEIKSEKNAHLPDLPAEEPNRRTIESDHDHECLTDEINKDYIREARSNMATSGQFFSPSSPYKSLNSHSNEISSCGYTICDAAVVRKSFSSKRSHTYHITFWVNEANDIGKDLELSHTVAQEAINELTAAYTDSVGFTFTYSVQHYTFGGKKSIMLTKDSDCQLAESLGYECLYPSMFASVHPDFNKKGFNLFLEDRMARDTNNGWAYLPATPYHSILAIKKDALRSGHTTIVHELGHAFGLYHVFQKFDQNSCDNQCRETASNADNTGDMVSDTKPIPINWNCQPTGRENVCGQTNFDKNTYRNFMGYAYPTCRKQYGHFTTEQTSRIVCYSFLNPHF